MGLKRLRWKGVAALLVSATVAGQAALAQQAPVDLELVLAVDVSGSMDPDEKQLQRDGYVAALRHPEVIEAIGAGFLGRIAVTYIEWAGPESQSVTLPWRLIDGPEAAVAVSRDLAAAPSARIRGTSISGALGFAAGLFDGNAFEGQRRIIDISGDGPNNRGPSVIPVRDAVVARGIVINGLPVMLKDDGPAGGDLLALYYEDCVIGGSGAFLIPVNEPEHFAEAIRRKLVLEIAGSPATAVAVAQRAQTPRIDCLIGERNRPSWLDEGLR
ncbi:MAG TPA: DUF1194 domain-containing protein [Alphaproteobacteria bacterium]|nr:DUF1194 domain-containing protein [Alphaproteobacteria bacterium]